MSSQNKKIKEKTSVTTTPSPWTFPPRHTCSAKYTADENNSYMKFSIESDCNKVQSFVNKVLNDKSLEPSVTHQLKVTQGTASFFSKTSKMTSYENLNKEEIASILKQGMDEANQKPLLNPNTMRSLLNITPSKR